MTTNVDFLRTVSIVGLLVMLAGCSGGGAEKSTATMPRPTSSPSAIESDRAAAADLTVTADVPYATLESPSSRPWLPPQLDVYAPTGAKDLPLVVLFHASPDHHDKSGYVSMAEAIARAGAVVVVPNWGMTQTNGDMLADGAQLEEVADAWQEQVNEGACATDFAVAHARDRGADPARLVFVGDTVGANVASVLALKGANTFPGCAASTGDHEPDGLMLLEGDWLLEDPSWDLFGEDGADLMQVLTPWALLDEHPDLPVTFGVTASSRQSMRRCDASESPDWLAWHDPDGALAERLRALGAYADGCIDIGEESEVMARAMKENGRETTVRDFADPASSAISMSENDLAILASDVLSLSDG